MAQKAPRQTLQATAPVREAQVRRVELPGAAAPEGSPAADPIAPHKTLSHQERGRLRILAQYTTFGRFGQYFGQRRLAKGVLDHLHCLVKPLVKWAQRTAVIA